MPGASLWAGGLSSSETAPTPIGGLISSRTPNQPSVEIVQGQEEREIAPYPANLALRLHRALSCIQKAEMAGGDPVITFTS